MKGSSIVAALFAAGIVGSVSAGTDFTVAPDGDSVSAVLAKIRAKRAAGDGSLQRVAVRGRNVLSETVLLTMFVDAARADFRLRPESPAFRLGFRAFAPERAGRR